MRPQNLDSYWDNVDAELAALPAQPVLEELALRSNEYSTVYALRLTSTGPYRIVGYLCVPTGDGPFPALLQTPRYGSVNHIPDYNDRLRYVCLQIMHRGQRLADQPYAARYPGLLTDGIDDPDEYVYRGIAADCLRGAEYLLSRADIDPARAAVQGDDLALITAARRTGFSLVNAAGLTFYQLNERRAATTAYPVEEVNEYCRAYPEQVDDVETTLALFDPTHHATAIACDVVFAAAGDESRYAPLANALGDHYQPYQLTNRGGTDHDAVDRLVAERMDVAPMSRFIRTFDR